MSNKCSLFSVQFEDPAKARLRELVAVPDFNRQLTIVSVVGGRGNGKSTVCSLLSGNSSMFEVKDFFLGFYFVPNFKLSLSSHLFYAFNFKFYP